MIRNAKKNKEIIMLYIFYIAYLFIKSRLFYTFHVSPIDYLNNFESGNYYIIELLPIYLIGLYLLLRDDNIYYNYRLRFRTNIINRQYKRIIIHTVVFVALNFIICIFLYNNIYSFFSIHSVYYYILLLIIYILGYMLVSGLILLLNQLKNFNSMNLIVSVYLLIVIEYFLFYENILSNKIPIFISWVFVDKSMVSRIVILILLNNILYTLVHNKSLNREFVYVKYDI